MIIPITVTIPMIVPNRADKNWKMGVVTTKLPIQPPRLPPAPIMGFCPNVSTSAITYSSP